MKWKKSLLIKKACNDIQEWQKKSGKILLFGGRKACLKRVLAQGRKEVEGTLLLGNDENNVIANKY